MKVNINKNKFKISVALFLVLLIVSCIGLYYGQGKLSNTFGFIATIIMALIISVLNMLEVHYDDNNRIKLLKKIVIIGTIFSSFIMAELLNSINMFEIDIKFIFLNIVIIAMIYFIIFIFTSKEKLAIIISNSLIFLLAFTNLLVTKFRGTPFVPWDILSIGTAATVAGSYSFVITPRVVLSIFILIFNIVVALKLKNNKISKKKKIIISLSSLAISCSFLFVFLNTNIIIDYFNITNDLWDIVGDYKRKGVILSISLKSRDLLTEKPDEYSEEKVAEIIENIDAITVSAALEEEKKVKPNIVVIMNESLSDLRVIEDFETNEEVFSFIYSLDENTIRGNLHVSVFGGGTPNTEWEFLTRQFYGIFTIWQCTLSTICTWKN